MESPSLQSTMPARFKDGSASPPATNSDPMEELLIVVFQFLFEILIQVLIELPWDQFLRSRPSPSHSKTSPGLWIILSLAIGASIGGVSLLIFPTTLLHWSSARNAYLIAAPSWHRASAKCSWTWGDELKCQTADFENKLDRHIPSAK